ncbi:MAG: hypothetical protein ACI9VM_000174 [Candidatus Azotimanducaceae bacterium]|jgi:hypothetical protein
MQFLTDILVAVLTSYLAFTNMLGDSIASLFPEQAAPSGHLSVQMAPEKKVSDETLAPLIESLESEYKQSTSLPDILIQNAAYQKASVIDGVRVEEINTTKVPDALVNIYCTYKTDNYVRTNTGTGFFIDSAGVILTNAHVAQFLILETVNKTGETECIIRAGDPAKPLYKAELLHISPAWILKHADLIAQENPQGTGERDYALLFVTAGLDNAPMPARFPYLSFDTSLLSTKMLDQEVLVAGYPAETFFEDGPDAELRPQSASSTVTDMFTFGSNYADIVSIAGSVIGEHGASGGPILNSEGKVIGLISTKGSPEEGSGSLRALTLSYVDRTILQESAIDLRQLISGRLALRAQLFTETIVPFLSEALESELE